MIAEIVAKAGPRALTPDVPEEERKVLASHQTFREAATYQARQRYIAMHKRQIEIARQLERTEHKAVNGLGEHYMRIDGEAYFQMRALYGEDCWADPDFIEAYRRDTPACRVKTTRGTRGQEFSKR